MSDSIDVPDEAAPAADRPGLIVKSFVADEINWTPGESSDVSYISTDVVDHDREVIVSAGIDTATVYMKNPIVLAKHDMKSWPIGTCEWIKVSKASKQRAFNGLIAKTLYDSDPDAQRVFGMVKRLVVKGKSVTIAPPDDLKPGEWGPPTKEEIKARPDWANADRIIRRSVLIEYSVVPCPANRESLVLAVSKGLELPSQLEGVVEVPAPEPAVEPAIEPAPEPVAEVTPEPEPVEPVGPEPVAKSPASLPPLPPLPKCRTRAEAEAELVEKMAIAAVERMLGAV